MKLSIFGIGYVGCVSAACFAREGHQVIAVDVNPVKVGMINSGQCPIVEADIAELVSSVVSQNQLKSTTDVVAAVKGSDLSLVCVGTPSNQNGSLDLSHVKRVCQEIGAALKEKNETHVVVIRSTMLPGTIEDVVVPFLEEHSGKRAGKDFAVAI